MGAPMANRLIQAGFNVTGFDLSEAARAKFQAAGGRVAATASDAVNTADVVITLLPDGKIVRAVLDRSRRASNRRYHRRHGLSDPIGTRELGNSFIAAALSSSDARISGMEPPRASATRPTTRPSVCTSWEVK